MQAETITPLPSTRQTNISRRNAQIQDEFRKRFTDQPRPRKYTREYIISELALDWCLSLGTIENILYTRPAAAPAPQGLAAAA